MQGLDPSHKVMQWHMAEVKRAPQQARVFWHRRPPLAVQALAIGDHAMSTQFHCEFTPQTVAGWSVDPGLCRQPRNGIWDEGAYPRLVAESFPLMPHMARMTRRDVRQSRAHATGLRK